MSPPLDDEVSHEIRKLVRGGFEGPDRIVEIVCEELYEPGEQDEDEVRASMRRELEALRQEQESWPKETDCDRLSRAFRDLERLGIIALENAGMTQSDGYSDAMEIYRDSRDKRRWIGYCFYHWQDAERAIEGEGLHLAFGPVDPNLEEAEGPKIGRLIAETLSKNGFQVTWNGTFGQRILVPKLDWKRRRP